MSNRHFFMWVLLLTCGGCLGLLMVPIEAAVLAATWLLGARDCSWREIGFVFRQFTDLRFLRERYPLTKWGDYDG